MNVRKGYKRENDSFEYYIKSNRYTNTIAFFIENQQEMSIFKREKHLFLFVHKWKQIKKARKILFFYWNNLQIQIIWLYL